MKVDFLLKQKCTLGVRVTECVLMFAFQQDTKKYCILQG